MKFSTFYELQTPKPWDEQSELRIVHEALDQIELADKLGYHYAWEVEHHFLEEYCHSSAPEVFLAAASQRTKNIRLGHGIVLMPPGYNQTARVAERIATLDLVSNGRVEWGTGESSAEMELGGYGVDPDRKRDMWREATEQCANMMAMTPYPGFEGEFFSMPCRNVVPKPVQKPHPPIWVACSRRSTIQMAAEAGIGALVFGFIDPEEAKHWVDEYYSIIKSDKCVPIGHTVNPNIAMIVGFSLNEDRDTAIAQGQEGFEYFSYALGHYYLTGNHKPGNVSIWDQFMANRDAARLPVGQGIGTPDEVRERMLKYQASGVDQVGFIQQCGKIRHEDICSSLELFADKVMPDLVADEEEREAKKMEELAPYIEQALGRKTWMEPLAPEDVPSFQARSKDIVAAVKEAGGSFGGLTAADTETAAE